MAAKLSGGGGGKYVIAQNADINITPFIDVLLVLMIVMMAAIPTATVSIKLDLPPAVPPPPGIIKKPTFISIAKDGSIFLADRPTTLAALPGAIGAAIGGPNPTQEQVFIRADADVKYEQFMDVLNKLEDNGYYKLGLINEEIS